VRQSDRDRVRPRPEGSPTEPAGAAARCVGASQTPGNGVPGLTHSRQATVR
jgi:hypothetical protein